MNIQIIGSESSGYSSPVVATCPRCGNGGTFDTISDVRDLRFGNMWLGQRKCPNRECCNHIFFIRYDSGELLTYPAQKFPFDRQEIPAEVLGAFDEAVLSHSVECYTAAAIMIRKTLEEICAERGATGVSLKKRLEALKATIILPQELLDALDDLRLLGNDAAHIESKNFNQVEKNEVNAGLELTREILKAAYQYKQLVDKLKALKKPATP
ncbi:MAG: DUF4145 domain-containing protein [Candidatus Berkelbacteria bacterium]|nr:DUF4145 domain-containing protein [Candidatus Berkelbacteria bacterium]MCR4307261.1 DUF4145 domain-containing protein [Candidatus Berkelbacteria bacterium]